VTKEKKKEKKRKKKSLAKNVIGKNVSAKVAIFLRKKSENPPYFKTMSSKKGGECQNKIGLYKISTSLSRMTFSQIWLIPLLDDHQPANVVWVTTIKYAELNSQGLRRVPWLLVFSPLTCPFTYPPPPPPPKDVGRRKKRKKK
jgi:hypothetical protein